MSTTRRPRPRPPAQSGLWGRQEPLPTTPANRRAAVNDLDLVASVIRAAQDPGYLLVGPAERVFLRDPASTGRVTHVCAVPRYEADTVSQLVDQGHLKIGGTHLVTDGRREGPARSVLVPTATRNMAARWAALHRLPVTLTPTHDTNTSDDGTDGSTGEPRDRDGSPSDGRTRGRGRELWCPECGEPAQQRPPERWTAANGPRPDHSHLDGEPLCPVVTAAGYRPAWPTTRRPR